MCTCICIIAISQPFLAMSQEIVLIWGRGISAEESPGDTVNGGEYLANGMN